MYGTEEYCKSDAEKSVSSFWRYSARVLIEGAVEFAFFDFGLMVSVS